MRYEKEREKKRQLFNLVPSTRLQKLRKITETINQDTCTGPDSNWTPPEHKSDVLQNEPTYSVVHVGGGRSASRLGRFILKERASYIS
jgi:hypothetical protein